LSQLWRELERRERLLFAKLITGSLRIGVSRGLVIRALAEAFDIERDVMAHRLMGKFSPTADEFQRLVGPANESDLLSRPYPFCLANPVSGLPQDLLQLDDTLAEWKWDGIRAQLIRRNGETYIWSRGEERIEDRFPELTSAAIELPDGMVLDGELLGWKDQRPLPFLSLQRRINRKSVGKKLLSEVPVLYQAFDLLEESCQDLRGLPLNERRRRLESLLERQEMESDQGATIRISPRLNSDDWEALTALRQSARQVGAEGLMLKSLCSTYATGRRVGHWWKWKVDPLTIDAVLIYAQRGHGRRATLYTDYTFALWHDGNLVPFAKAYSGLTDAEMGDVDRFVRQNTIERFGPVRSVRPELVMELAFENIQRSDRHKSGVAVRFPRILRWRQDKPASQANTLAELHSLAELV
ncbi:MAG: ATP-dependent DNA ligase, partial [Planctomycetales bacterium]|nr:ATP-dependent DNA ligase [Planctomycetales bacterium]